MVSIYTMGLEDPQDLASSNTLHLSNAMGITKNNTNLGWCQTLLGKLTDVLFNLNSEITIKNLNSSCVESKEDELQKWITS